METKLEVCTYVDPTDDVEYECFSDAPQDLFYRLPEIEWYAVKHVLQNFGYSVIEKNTNLN